MGATLLTPQVGDGLEFVETARVWDSKKNRYTKEVKRYRYVMEVLDLSTDGGRLRAQVAGERKTWRLVTSAKRIIPRDEIQAERLKCKEENDAMTAKFWNR